VTITGTDYGGANLTPASGDVLSGTFTNVGTFTVTSGYTVYVADGVTFSMDADNVTIAGTLNGDGRGSNGGTGGRGSLQYGNTGSGSGPGTGGQWGNCVHPAGGGGGGYGASGGGGGVGIPWSTPGSGGASYGSSSSITEYTAGSGGGGGASTCDGYNGGNGGDGGGAIYIYASSALTVSGTITSDGSTGTTGGGGGGGGAGGAIVLDSPSVTFSGSASLTATGGNAGNGYWGYAGGGGGGAGGRIKVQYGCLTGSYSTAVTGGTGGSNAYNDTYYGYIASSSGGTGTTYSVSGYSGLTTYYLDADGDGYGDPSRTTTACSVPSGYSANDDDCDDSNRAVNPAATDVCDGIDNDCDGLVDDGTVATDWYEDADRDGYGDAGTMVSDCAAPSGYVSDDSDCDDLDATVYPGAPETCNDVDDDCDGRVDDSAVDGLTWYADADGDSYGNASRTSVACDPPAGYVGDATDCNDAAAGVYPGATEVCNSVDDDCDGRVDDSAVDAGTWYADSDADTYGDASVSSVSCSAPSGYVSDARDCDDSDRTVYPGATETCDGVDEDCDGRVDDNATDAVRYYADTDGDRYGDPATSTLDCAAPSGYVANDDDCDDDAASVYPTATELCNGVDDDCDGSVDDGATGSATWYADTDADSFGDAASGVNDCIQPSGTVTDATDCDDTDGSVYPGATEIPYDGIDQDCVGGDLADLDGDGYAGDGGTDCNDNDGDVNPAATEVADGVDEDCDGLVDEGTDWYDDDGDGYTEDGGDCDDGEEARNPASTETADGVDEDCDGVVDEGTDAYDDDGDGYTELDGDCNDGDPAQSPANPEIDLNGIDDDCDGAVDAGIADNDGDGYTEDGGDCDNGNGAAHPGADETADGVDNDCDGLVDEGTAAYDDDLDGASEDAGDCDDGDSTTNPAADEVADGVDNDCDGVVDEGTELYDDDGDGFTEEAGDCDDADAGVNPAAAESANGVDDDCDGQLDPSEDGDGDGYALDDDCDDQNGWANPGSAEMCDGVDNNCDGVVDEGCDAEEDVGGDGAAVKTSDACGCASGTGSPLGVVGLLLLAVALRRRAAPRALGVLAGALTLVGCNPDYAVEKEARQLVVSPLLQDLGDVPLGESGEVVVTLTAVAGASIQVVAADLVNLSGEGFSAPTEALPTLTRDSTATLTVGYEALADGWDHARLTIQTDEEVDNLHVVDVRAHATSASASLWPSVLDFGPVAVGGTGSVEAVLTNTGETPLELVSLALSPATVTSPIGAGVLEVGADLAITLDFTPTDDAPMAGSLALTLGAGAEVGSVALRGNDCANGSAELYDADGDGWSACASDCDDADPTAHPAGVEVCDGLDQDCDGLIDQGTRCYDDDGDGFSEDDGDCNDADSGTNPSATETLGNGRDDNCDGVVDQGTVDLDGDGISADGGDCDDADASVWPGAPEAADGVDNDCDGVRDEGTTAYDDDGDGVTEAAGDCADGDRSVYPGASELPDWIDNDCDGTVDEGTDRYDDDGDGYTEDGGDCDDADAGVGPAVYDPAGGAGLDCDGTA